MDNISRIFSFLVITTEFTHVLCCGLPIIVSTVSLLSGLGFVISLPGPIDALHHFTHDYEIHVIVFSAAVLFLGWALHLIASQIDCRSSGCGHGPCAPKKKRSNKILNIATILFSVNMIAYFVLHH